MKQLRVISAMLVLTVLVLAACSKKSSTPAKTNTDFLTQASWKFDNATVNGINVSSALQTCQTDNVLTFSSNGTGSVDEGPTKCTNTDPQTDAFTWNFASNETVLHVSQVFFAGGSSDFNIVTLNDTQ